MSSGVSTEETSASAAKIADDWESDNVVDLQLAQVAERQKQLAQRAAEAEQLRFSHNNDDTATVGALSIIGGASGSGMVKLPEASIRLLRRPANSQHTANATQQSGANAKNRPMTLEEREAAYNEARKRIFGGATSDDGQTPATDGASAGEGASASETAEDDVSTRFQPQNYLSDVEMVSAASSSKASSMSTAVTAHGPLPLFYRSPSAGQPFSAGPPPQFVGCIPPVSGWPGPPLPSAYNRPSPPLMSALPPSVPARPYPLMSAPAFLPPQPQQHLSQQHLSQQQQYGQPPAFIVGQPSNLWPPLSPSGGLIRPPTAQPAVVGQRNIVRNADGGGGGDRQRSEAQ